MTIGPLEYIVVGFPGNKFNGAIAPALAKLIESNTIRILDLLFIAKDADGDVVAVEFDELDDLAAFADLDGETGGLIPRTTSSMRPPASSRIPRPRCSSGRTSGQRSSLPRYATRAASCWKAAVSRTSSSSSRSRISPTQPDRPPTRRSSPCFVADPSHAPSRAPP